MKKQTLRVRGIIADTACALLTAWVEPQLALPADIFKLSQTQGSGIFLA